MKTEPKVDAEPEDVSDGKDEQDDQQGLGFIPKRLLILLVDVQFFQCVY